MMRARFLREVLANIDWSNISNILKYTKIPKGFMCKVYGVSLHIKCYVLDIESIEVPDAV